MLGKEDTLLKVYSQTNNQSAKKLIGWLNNRGINYHERNVDKEPLSEKELLSLLCLTENGFEDVLSTVSLKHRLNLTMKDLESLTVNELITMMINNPTLLKKPLVVKEDHLLVGYNKLDIRTLIPKEERSQDRMHYYIMSET